jgi:iron complex outermembrane receptor protein
MTLTSISAYEKFDRVESNDWDGTPVENLDVFMTTDIEVWSQELRLTSDGSSDLSWIAGAYWSTDEVTESWEALGSQSTIYYGIFGSVDTRYQQDADTAALFGSVDWQFASNFRLNVGARYTREEREFAGCGYDVDGGLAFLYNLDFGPTPGLSDRTVLSSTTLSQGDCVVVDPSQAQLVVDETTGVSTYFSGASGVFDDSFTIENLSGRIGLDWLPNDDWLVFVSVGNGYKSGGYNGAATSTWTQLEPYDEETLLAYEVGFKATLLDGSMQLNSSAFYYDYTDKQIVGFIDDPVFGLLTQLVNVPESEITGIETELEWQPTSGLYLRFGAIWLDSEVNDYVGIDGVGNVRDFAGQELAQNSEWQYNGLASYEWGISDSLIMRASVDVNFKDNYQSAIDDNPLFYVDDYTIWNSRLAIGAADGQWELALWSRNLTDEYYYTSANLSNDYWFRTAGQGVTYGASFNYNLD